MTDLVMWLRQQLDEEQQTCEQELRGFAIPNVGWSPTMVLAQIAAMRGLLDAYTEAVEFFDAPARRHLAAGEVHGLWTALRWLAVPYADRPGYDETWRPT